MKKLFIALFTMSLAGMMTSCEKASIEEDGEETEYSKTRKDVMFVMKGITEEFSTKATLSSVSCTDLWVFEGTTLLAHKVSTDEDFETPTISLTYGSHDLTFIASASKEQSWADGVWSTTKVIDDYATTMNVTVSGNSSSSRQVQLTRRNSRIKFVSTDKVPTSVSKCHITAQSHNQLETSLNGGNAFTYETSKDITTQGSAYSIFVNVLTESPTDEEDCDVMIEFLDASSNILYHYERTIKLKPNRCTTLEGAFFSGGSNTITVNDTWLDEVVTPLYSE